MPQDSEQHEAGNGLTWLVAGLAVGLAAGVLLAQWLGPDPGRRLARAARRLGGEQLEPEEAIPPLTAARAVAAAQNLLAAHPELRELSLEPVAVGPGVLELHGWVPSRALRTRAARLVAALPGITSLVNCLLVRGEDDDAAGPPPARSRSSA